VAPDELRVEDGTAEAVGALAHSLSIPLHHIAEVEPSLEDAYLALTGASVEYHGGPPAVSTTMEAAR
jgi:ABC-2 type transport system ATP-binding protein